MNAISVVVPVFNSGLYLEDCLNSILSQTYADFEVLCVDSHSTDNSWDILQKYASQDSRFRLFTNDEAGVCQARNVGINNATGEYLMFLDSDDYIHPRYMEIMLRIMQEEKADIVQARHVRVPYDSTSSNLPDVDLNPPKVEGKDALRSILTAQPCPFEQKHDSWVNIWKKLYRVSALKDLRFSPELFNEDDADYSLFSELSAQKKVWIDSVLYFYRENPNSITRSLNVERYCRSCVHRIPLWHHRLFLCKDFPDDLKTLFIKKQTKDAFRMLLKKPLKKGGKETLLKDMSDALAQFEKEGMIHRKYLGRGDEIVFKLFKQKRFSLAKALLMLGF